MTSAPFKCRLRGSWGGQSPIFIMALGAAHCPLSRVVARALGRYLVGLQ